MEGVIKGQKMKPPRVVVHSEPKIGKTTFAAGAPGAFFLQVEEGADECGAERTPMLRTLDEVSKWVARLLKEQHDYQTLVVDSADWLERLIHERVAKEAGVPTIEGIGYGKGYVAASDYLAKALASFDRLRDERGMAIVVLCHSEVRRFDSPEVEPYDRWTLKMHKSATALLTEWCDVIGFAEIETWIDETDVGFKKSVRRGKSTGKRVLHLESAPSHLAGNRYGLPKKIPLDWDELVRAFAKKAGKKMVSEAENSKEEKGAEKHGEA